MKKKVIKEVQEGDVRCVNPMSVASKKEGKRRLVIDLSGHINTRCKTNKFKIESQAAFTNSIQRGDSMFSFDFRSAFHHVQMHQAHRKFLVFSMKVGVKKIIYRFKNMPFGYRDVSRLITRVFRVS